MKVVLLNPPLSPEERHSYDPKMVMVNPLIFSIAVVLFYELMRLYLDEAPSQFATLLFAYQPFSVLITAVPYAEAIMLLFSIVPFQLVLFLL